MIIPDFQPHELDPALLGADITDAFQRFVYDCLHPTYPGLHLFPTGGKDGGIDLSSGADGQLTVGECKFIGRDDLTQAQNAWGEVRDRLRTHLRSADGPSKGQGQYAPWYRTDRPIREYVFCVSSRVKNQNQGDKLQEQIRNDFAALVNDFPHVSHLAGLEVRVYDWGDFEGLLKQNALLQFRWFRRARPTGIRPFSEADLTGSFRTYLNSDAIPYYSRGQFLTERPDLATAGIPDEEELVTSLERGEWDGLIVVGPGGTGKTRLTLELARLADRRGWLVLAAGPSVRPADLDAVVARLSPTDRVLLVVDYLERQRHFEELRERLHDIRDSLGLSLHYVVNCRSSYYQHQITHSADERAVSLTAPDVEGWSREYRLHVVRHILTHSGLEVTFRHLERCRDVPALAMFMAYLHAQGREVELRDLLAEPDFASWVDRRVSLTFPGMDVRRELALLAAVLPFTTATVTQLPASSSSLLARLAEDGWVVQSPGDLGEAPHWRALHDILADEIVLHYVQGPQDTAQLFGTELLSLAVQQGCVRSALETLQRLADQPRIAAVTWLQLVRDGLRVNAEAWRPARDLVLRTSLVEPQDKINLLHEHAQIWEGDERETWFQNLLGHLARWLAREAKPEPSQEAQDSFAGWIERSGNLAEESNFVLNWGLRLYPERLSEAALTWVHRHPYEMQTHYLLVAWLEVDRPREQIERYVAQWLTRWGSHSKASFIYPAYLENGGPLARVETALLSWITTRGHTLEARFVYKHYLEHGGTLARVEVALRGWIVAHSHTPEAVFIYKPYLEHGGTLAQVEVWLLSWIAVHGHIPEARFIYKPYLEHGGTLAQVEAAIHRWIAVHGHTPEAGFVYKPYLEHGGALALVDTAMLSWIATHGHIPEARFIYKPYLEQGGTFVLVEEAIHRWIAVHGHTPEAGFVYKPYLEHGGALALVETAMLDWVTAHGRISGADFIYRTYLEHGGTLARVEAAMLGWIAEDGGSSDADFIYRAYLEHGGKLAKVEASLLGWIAEHGRSPAASFLYGTYLEHGGSLAKVEASLLGWIAEHGRISGADFNYRAYLEHGGALAEVETPLLGWIAEHGRSPAASFLYGTYLKCGGGYVKVESNLLAWIGLHGRIAEASFVLSAYLKYGGSLERVESILLDWLRDHGTTPEASFVYVAYLKGGGNLARVEEALIAWVEACSQHRDVDFVCTTYLNRGGRLERVEKVLLSWIDAHGSQPEASFVYAAYLNRGGALEKVESALLSWLRLYEHSEQARYVLMGLARRVLSRELLLVVLNWCQHLENATDTLIQLSNLDRQLQRSGFDERVVTITESVVQSQLAQFGDGSVSGNRIAIVMANLIEAPGMQEGAIKARVDRLLVAFAQHPSAGALSTGGDMQYLRSLITRLESLATNGNVWAGISSELRERCALWRRQLGESNQAWERVSAALQNGETLTALVTENVKGGLNADVGVRAFLPASHLGDGKVRQREPYVGTFLPVKIIELQPDQRRVVVSHRLVYESERAALREETVRNVAEGQVRKGIVRRIVDYGAFVDLGGIDGLLHISEISWTGIQHPGEVLNVNDEVQLRVVKTDLEQGRISLSRRQMLTNPWPEVPGEYAPGAVVTAQVVRVAQKGGLVTLDGGLEGIISHREVLAAGMGPSELELQVGASVTVRIVELDAEERRLLLSLLLDEPKGEDASESTTREVNNGEVSPAIPEIDGAL